MSIDDAPQSDSEADARDVRLMALAAGGDTGAFRELVETHQGRVFGTVVRMLGGTSDADDIAQQVFVRVWQSAGRYERKARFTTWLHTITRNLVLNELRRRQRHPATPLETELGDRAVELRDPDATSPSDSLLAAELQEAVRQAIEALPEQQRTAVVLRRYEDMPYEEIAAVLGTSVPSVKSLLFRARTTLRERLARYV
jgi:RNA polymerase sigma-70 factor (ECF subfamily)